MQGASRLGSRLVGGGNNGEDGTEGAIYKRAYGCYLHGSLLPKNPRLADLLLAQALERRHGAVELQPLDDRLELAAHARRNRADAGDALERAMVSFRGTPQDPKYRRSQEGPTPGPSRVREGSSLERYGPGDTPGTRQESSLPLLC